MKSTKVSIALLAITTVYSLIKYTPVSCASQYCINNHNSNECFSNSSSNWRQQLLDDSLLESNDGKFGPQFVVEPPQYTRYLNSSDLVLPCSASGNPQPTIVSLIK